MDEVTFRDMGDGHGRFPALPITRFTNCLVHQLFLESWCSGASSCTSPGKLAKSLVNGSIESVNKFVTYRDPLWKKILKKQKKNITKFYYFTLLLRYLLHFFLSIEIPVKCEVDGPTSSTSRRWVLGLKAEPDIKWPAVFLFQILLTTRDIPFLRTSNMYSKIHYDTTFKL